ncbi:MAG: energy-coupling factor transporter transmembrane protein EcfT [Roseburia sp.]|nr:energy-coupling factor transporter transmembrane protein EcfT [Roseburia sp.]
MLRDITIGQYYPVESKIHALDPRVKIVAVLVYLVSLFLFHDFAGYIIVSIFLVSVIYMSRVPFSYLSRGLKPVIFLIIFTAFFNIFFTSGDVLFEWELIKGHPILVTWQGLRKGLFMVLRLVYLVIGSSLLTYTTTPNKLTDGIESLLKPLAKLRVPVHDLAMMMSLALRFIPILLEEANRIIKAQSARGASFDEGKITERLRAMVSILVPLLVSATRRAYDLALAMEARCYRGGEGRTKMKPLKYLKSDVAAYFILVVYLAALLIVNRFAPF